MFEARARLDPSGFDLAALEADWKLVTGWGPEHLLVSSGARTLRLDLVAGSFLAGPVALDLHFPLNRQWRRRQSALSSLDLLTGSPALAASRARDRGLARMILGLRVLDALDSGASLRAIGHVLLSDEWPGPGESVKSRIRRLCAFARALRAGGPRLVLR